MTHRLARVGLPLIALLGLGTHQAAAEAPVLTLHDLLVASLSNNLELEAKRIDPAIQQNRLDGARGAFDPSFVAALSYSDSERPQNYVNNAVGGRFAPIFEETVARGQVGLTGRLPYGTQYEFLTGVDRTSNTSILTPGNGFSSFTARYRPREYLSTTTLTLTQPLLKDFGRNANLAEVRLQRSALAASNHELTATALRILRDVASAYYEMVFAQENIRVKEEAVALAEALVRDNQRRVDEGRMAPIDVTQARARVAEAREELLLARNFLAQRRNTLLELTRDNFDFDLVEFTVDPAFVANEAPVIERDDALSALFTRNPTYLASAEIVRSEDIRVAYAENQKWPRVDLKATLGINGMQDSFMGSYRDNWNRDQPNYSVGVVVNVPLFNRTGRARVSEAENRKRQALLALKRTEVALLSAFDTARRDIENAAERTVLVRDSVSLAAAALDAQERLLGTGKATSFEVAQAQKELSQARSRELATVVDLNKSIAQLQFILGTLPDHLRVAFDFE